MRLLSTTDLLNIWDKGNGISPLEKALLLLTVAIPEKSGAQLAKLSLGQRDSLLLTLREKTFGNQVISVVACPKCGKQVELNFKTSDIAVSSVQEVSDIQSLTVDDYKIQFHLPNSEDMIAISQKSLPIEQKNNNTLEMTNLTLTQRLLLEQCLEEIFYQGEKHSLDQLPSSVINAIQTQMAETDPQADIQLNLECPICGHTWQVLFDIVSFFWSEINSWAKQILYEVHLLATAYGWSERDIIALSPQRRNFYLEMIQK